MARAGVDLEQLALFDEQRHLDDVTCLERGRLRGAGGRVPLEARLGLGDFQGNEDRMRETDGAFLEEQDVGKGDFLYPSFTGTCVLLSPEDSDLSETLDDAHDYMQRHAVAMSRLAENSTPKED